MAQLLPSPETQFCDANGHPYAAGTIATYEAGTSTPKTTWLDSGAVTANPNPIVLDGAGRAIIYGDGAYRLVLKDANGNEIWDQTSTTLVSVAMAPVVIAATLADARTAMGIDTAIGTETSRAVAAEGALNTAISSEASARTAADSTLTTNLAAEVSRAEAAEAALAASISGLSGTGLKSGSGTTDGTGHVRVTYGSPFATATDAFVCTLDASGLLGITLSAAVDRFGADVWSVWTYGAAAPSTTFFWMAIGH